jgi:hypothetical protein
VESGRRATAALAAGSQTVQQQALRDFAQAMRNYFHRTQTRIRPTGVRVATMLELRAHRAGKP